jgi:uncharacterized protein YkwD
VVAFLKMLWLALLDALAQPDPPPLPPSDSLLDLHNFERRVTGAAELKRDIKLDAAAERYSRYLASFGRLRADHLDQFGNGPGTRVSAIGYSWGVVGENCAVGASAQDVFRQWMTSSWHRQNIQDRRFVHMGYAAAPDRAGNYYWTAVYGRPL